MYGCYWIWRIIFLQYSHQNCGLVGAKHSVHVCEAEVIRGAESAACGVYAVEHNCIGFVVHSKVNSPLRTNPACIITGFAADKGNVSWLKALNGSRIRQNKRSLQIELLLDSQ